ncbi:lipoprotein [Moraxella haemolytica]|uniref:LPS translocon maturation chaperone LptM n=1 Tax=Moraxella TaxID=475 RepID=UPI0025436E7E|nr:lipoprotein [Moraxella sp. ZY171148]WII95608.1 lipoprotein [Moraxella sp. ZY171148]
MKATLIPTLLCTLLAISLTACGQKGALYLPEKPQTIPTTQTQEQSAATSPNDY